jgi:integrase
LYLRAGGEIGIHDGLKSRWTHVRGGSSPPPPNPQEGAKVFTFRGKPLKDIRTAFENACNRAGIKNLTFHTLRHTFATRLVLSGVDLATVSKLLGHSTIQMTMRYSHPTPEALKNAVSKLDK